MAQASREVQMLRLTLCISGIIHLGVFLNGAGAIDLNDLSVGDAVNETEPPKKEWPIFRTQSHLNDSPWAKYFIKIYGGVPTLPKDGTPFRVEHFWCLSQRKLKEVGVNIPVESEGKCPTKSTAVSGQRYDENNEYSSKDWTWIWHPLDSLVFNGFRANDWVEVDHLQDPFGDETHGMWCMYARGSGVYLYTGTTKIFNEHADSYSYFQANSNPDMSQKAAAAGYDTVQFVKHRDKVNYPCAEKSGVSWMNVEIVAVKLVGTFACGQKTGTPSAFHSGWGGKKPCKCDNNYRNVNCHFSKSDDSGDVVV